MDVRATLPPKKEFAGQLQQALQQVPKLVKESQQLQQSLSQDQQLKELYGKIPFDPKKPNPYAKPFIPKGTLPQAKVEKLAVPTKNQYVKNVASDGKVSWILKPKE